jgi:hypothetical protein
MDRTRARPVPRLPGDIVVSLDDALTLGSANVGRSKLSMRIEAKVGAYPLVRPSAAAWVDAKPGGSDFGTQTATVFPFQPSESSMPMLM